MYSQYAIQAKIACTYLAVCALLHLWFAMIYGFGPGKKFLTDLKLLVSFSRINVSDISAKFRPAIFPWESKLELDLERPETNRRYAAHHSLLNLTFSDRIF